MGYQVMNMLLKKSIDLNQVEIKTKGNGGTFEGYASVFGGVDSYNDTIESGAYKNVLKSGRTPKMFLNHASWELPIGKWTSLAEDSKGLIVVGELTPNHATADMVKASLNHQTLDGLSIGFRMTKDDYEIDNGRRIIKNISELIEISVVTFPADSAARVDLSSVKSELDSINSITELEAFLREAGGFSKGLAVALLARSKKILAGEQQGSEIDEKARAELKRLLNTPSL